MNDGKDKLIRRDAYRAPAYWIRSVELGFDLDPAKTLVTSRMRIERNLDVPPEPLRLARREPDAAARPGRRPERLLPQRKRFARNRRAGRRCVHARDPQHLRAGAQHGALRPLHLGWRSLHTVRGRGLSPHHLLSRPAGRDVRLHRHAARASRGVSGPAVQRQPGRARRARRRPPLREVARPVPEAELPLRPRRGGSGRARTAHPHPRRARSPAADLRAPRRPRQDRARDELAHRERRVGRGALRPRARSRSLHDRRGRRLQHGRDGEQGPQHLQRQLHPRQPVGRDGWRLRVCREHRRP